MTVAGLGVVGEELVVRLSPAEKFWAFHRDVRVPLSAVRAVVTSARPWSELRGWRSSGTGVLGVAALGVRRHGGGRDFVALHRQQPVVQVELNGQQFARLVVSVDDPERTAGEIAAAAGIAR